MNIDKQEMLYAFNNRHDPKQYMVLMDHFEQMNNHFASKFRINYNDRSDIKQEVLWVAIKALEKYDASKKSNPFSYFYKVFNTGFLYFMRRKRDKSLRSPSVCSFEFFENVKEANEPESPVEEESFINVDGEIWKKDELTIKIKDATKFAKKLIKTVDEKDYKKVINEHPDAFVRKFARKYIEQKG